MGHSNAGDGGVNGLPYYKAYPRDFLDGTVGMPLELKGAYRILLDLIYLHGGKLTDDSRYISGHLGCSVRAWKKHRSDLIGRGKISADLGIISNFRADKETETLRSFQDKQRENASKPRKNNDLSEAMANPKRSHTDTDTDTDKKDTDANASVARARPPAKARLPDGWRPSEFGMAFAREKGLTETEATELADEFAIYWSERGDRKTERGWDQTWRNRVTDRLATIIRNRRVAVSAYPGGGQVAGTIASIAARRATERRQ